MFSEKDREVKTAYQGLKVLELADAKGMYCGKMLASLGAEVLKIERPGGDVSRQMGPFAPGPRTVESSLSFAYLNTGKKGITLDLSSQAGKNIFLRLVKEADAVIETFKPGTMERFGLGYDVLHGENPQLIMLSITPFGQTGPHSKWSASTDLIVDAMGGPMADSGYQGKPPLHMSYDIQSHTAAMYALFALQAAYHNRLFTGEGIHIDVSQQECFAVWYNQTLGFTQIKNMNPPRRQDTTAHGVRQGLVNCKDGFAVVMIGGKWQELLEWFSDQGIDITVLKDPSYEAHIHEVLTPWDQELLMRFNELGSRYTKAEFMREGQRRRIPVGVLETADSILFNENLKARDYFISIDHPVLGSYLYPGAPALMTESPHQIGRPAPLLGEHNEEIYRLLGYSDMAIHDMQVQGVI